MEDGNPMRTDTSGKMSIRRHWNKWRSIWEDPHWLQLYMHRKHIVVGQTVKRNLVQEILRLKFRHPENFMPNRAFYQEVGINQMRWWDIFYGRKNINQEEYIALSKYFGITLEEAFAARQLCIFEEQ